MGCAEDQSRAAAERAGAAARQARFEVNGTLTPTCGGYGSLTSSRIACPFRSVARKLGISKRTAWRHRAVSAAGRGARRGAARGAC